MTASGEFAAFELAGWQRAAAAYDEGFARLTSQAVEPLLDAAGVEAGTRVLDVATGPGYAAEAAAARGAIVTGIDFSAPMVERARRRSPGIAFEVGDAQDLPFPDSAFDAVIVNFGLLHLPDPDRAIGEAARVLRPGGRLAFTVWAGPEEAVGFGLILRAVAAHGDPNAPLPAGPPFFRFSDVGECERTLLEAGLAQPSVRQVAQSWSLERDGELFDIMLSGTVRTSGLLNAQRPDALERIRRSVAEGVAGYRREGRIELPMPAVLARGVKPF